MFTYLSVKVNTGGMERTCPVACSSSVDERIIYIVMRSRKMGLCF